MLPLGLAMLAALCLRRRPAPLATLCCIAALLTLAWNALVVPICDDTVFYLADSWASMQGESLGQFPMRYLMFRPFLLLNWRPSATVLLANAAACGCAVVCGLVVARLAQRCRLSVPLSASLGAASVLWLVCTSQMVFARPDYFTLTLVLLGVWLLLAPPQRTSGRAALLLAFALLALAVETGPRHCLFLPAAWMALLCDAGLQTQPHRFRWAALGTLLGLAPGLIFVTCFDSWANVRFHNWDLLQARFGGSLPATVGPSLHFGICVLAAAGSLIAWRQSRAVAIFWGTALLLLLAVPHNVFDYVQAPWLAFSFLSIAVLLSHLPERRVPDVVAVFLVAWLALMPLLGPRRPGRGDLAASWHGVQSQLGQMDWLDDLARGGTVDCVAPCHPIRAHNAWVMYDAWKYCYMTRPDAVRMADPQLLSRLLDGEPRVIAWDAWPGVTPNLLAFLAAREVVSPEQLPAVAESLRSRYRIVRYTSWAGSPQFGDSRFLVRRDVPLDDRAQVLDDALIHP